MDTNLEVYFQTKLENAGVARRGDGSEARCAYNCGWRSEWWSIGHVKCFSTKFDIAILAEVSALYDCDIGVAILWTTYRITRAVTDRKLRRDVQLRLWRISKAQDRTCSLYIRWFQNAIPDCVCFTIARDHQRSWSDTELVLLSYFLAYESYRKGLRFGWTAHGVQVGGEL